ncbi:MULTISPECIES: DUF3509 domain-containing protein [Pseudomonas]|uniref:DUF3509 domain-containing protein n=2 Tax=Pseudomonadaceae TaxID=135621 RepID=A0A0D0KBE7_9PSED|nr:MULTISPECIES: DUF3509 domain-containing protein [Pseudomonas]KIP96606.1 hypothetical protein RU08_20285 [Pseudomonas fulva]MCW2291899.1 hypothetical protein [Pseudomonas sp. BIGb0408]NYH73530.1 hypothetical protein [Pseudomonas flavescens]UCJ16015.1 DUF3509 domain-containing protein [Pseudomonas sp. MM211]
MENSNRQLVDQLFAPLRATFSRPRPDGSIVLSLIDEADTTAYSRVLQKLQLNDSNAFAQSLEDIRLELAVRAGNIPAEMRKMLKEQDSVISYHHA